MTDPVTGPENPAYIPFIELEELKMDVGKTPQQIACFKPQK